MVRGSRAEPDLERRTPNPELRTDSPTAPRPEKYFQQICAVPLTDSLISSGRVGAARRAGARRPGRTTHVWIGGCRRGDRTRAALPPDRAVLHGDPGMAGPDFQPARAASAGGRQGPARRHDSGERRRAGGARPSALQGAVADLVEVLRAARSGVRAGP